MWMVVICDHAYQGKQAALKNEMIFHLLQSFSPPRPRSIDPVSEVWTVDIGRRVRRIDRPVVVVPQS